jgi:ABC-type polysaccharide transport system permease subunit
MVLELIIKTIFTLIWTLVLNWMCKKGFSGLAWIIVLLPLFLTLFVVKDGFQQEIAPGYD